MSRPKGSKNKPKGNANGILTVKSKKTAQALANHPRCASDDGRTTWISDISAFCMKKGFLVTQLIEKYEELENRLGEMIANSSHITTRNMLTLEQVREKYGAAAFEAALKAIESQNKPLPAPQIEKDAQVPKKENKATYGASNGTHKPHQQLTELTGEKNDPQPPEGLTEIQLMVWKNEQKKKTQVKKPPVTNFGAGQKE